MLLFEASILWREQFVLLWSCLCFVTPPDSFCILWILSVVSFFGFISSWCRWWPCFFRMFFTKNSMNILFVNRTGLLVLPKSFCSIGSHLLFLWSCRSKMSTFNEWIRYKICFCRSYFEHYINRNSHHYSDSYNKKEEITLFNKLRQRREGWCWLPKLMSNYIADFLTHLAVHYKITKLKKVVITRIVKSAAYFFPLIF